jgi:integration host factor subunit alpha
MTAGAVLRVARSNTIERPEGKRGRRGPQERVNDTALIEAIRRVADAQPTYGYQRITAILKRELQADGSVPVSAKRVYRLMKKHSLLLERNPDHTITRSQLADAIYRQAQVSRNEAAQLIDEIIDKMSDALEWGDMVKISRFGSFSVRQKGPRMGRDPRTGRQVLISPRRVLLFRASPMLRQRLR